MLTVFGIFLLLHLPQINSVIKWYFRLQVSKHDKKLKDWLNLGGSLAISHGLVNYWEDYIENV